MPGWGRSPAQTTGPLQAQDATRVVIDILDAAGAVDATLLGKSWGGGIALQTALDYPGRVRSLILTAPAFRDFSVLGQLQAPVLLVWAEDDPVIPISFAREYMERIADLRLVTYPHGGHSAAPKNADEFAPEAVAFLRQTIASEDADQRDRAQHST
jgi:pimeloyl-ACP methyl ester carboxylesterase